MLYQFKGELSKDEGNFVRSLSSRAIHILSKLEKRADPLKRVTFSRYVKAQNVQKQIGVELKNQRKPKPR